MPAFRYEAVDAQRQARARACSTPRRARQVRDQLRARGPVPDGDRRRKAPTPAATRGAPRSRLRLPAAQVALSTRQLATLVRSGMPLDQALAAVAEQADDARAAKLFAGAARAGRAPANRWPARSRAGRGRSPTCIAASSRVGAETGQPARRARAARRLSRGAAGAAAEVHAGAHLPGARDRHRARGDRRAAGLRRAAGRLRLPAEPADAAVAHAGADRASRLPARDRLALARGRRRGDGRVRAREPARGVSRALARARCCARPVAGPARRRRRHRALREHAGDPRRQRRAAAALARRGARRRLGAAAARRRPARRRRSCARACRWRAR